MFQEEIEVKLNREYGLAVKGYYLKPACAEARLAGRDPFVLRKVCSLP